MSPEASLGLVSLWQVLAEVMGWARCVQVFWGVL